MVSGLAKNALVKNEASRDLRLLQERRERLVRNLRDFSPPEQVTALQNRIARWDELAVWEKNELLLRIFDRWEFRKLGGSDSQLEMVMILRGGRELPPVPVKVWGNERRILRRLPTVEEWIDSVLAAQLRKRAVPLTAVSNKV